MKKMSDNIHTDTVSLVCESVCVLSGELFVQNISYNICTDMFSLLCDKSVCVLSGYSYMQNISDNIHTDNDFLFEYESEWESGEAAFFHGISENSHVDRVLIHTNSCASQHVSAVRPNRQSSFYNKCRQMGLMNPWSNNKVSQFPLALERRAFTV